MMYPVGRCRDCGERPFKTVDGGTVCHNCRTLSADAEHTTEVELQYDDGEHTDVEAEIRVDVDLRAETGRQKRRHPPVE
jgi:predicted  nucleic acid-binding Zn-ribbon protein